ncbi:hypothetical protein JQX09_04515 [Sulfitobacter pseudonitzschiae]|uniref:Uncharacterized protein n=1 Tax=Pseudosulfitobacter pseudonitzschiae TaxID=1402135 RepID=A0A9Q2RW82_9RHOB|nr:MULTISPECIES: hypothetical protein [Roseobacteraceae]MBM2291156.1 hypothetical protein [Pseudosulfitobacter pseudonitzschiae]MBM2296074.1 hypothetical protein [Pseudosulfitobacter pseudonitzschiae]MBM2300987.1 hypothetical protein [Pseudosulfitobacter pseudonitzschiae]MBM2310771.1 hypothetical protein [Pseudosulfitobacter pseudonitzschiae]MBM2315684.1 hypothetical protein [Pseudosulfitobacter pseudonitzschiae]|tara:strand:- start:3253 stop:3396 length:144 start_codon:yes stop_codon:yes gene_type:complete
MTNTLSLILAAILIAWISYDVFANDSANLLFLGKELFDLIEWLAFWR